MMKIEHLKTHILDLPPSCIEFWPLDAQYAVIGTYNLEKASSENVNEETPDLIEEQGKKKAQSRNGSLILVHVVGEDVKIIQTVPTPSAILDVHFLTSDKSFSRFGAATSTGSIEIYELRSGNGESGSFPQLFYDQTLQYFPEDVLITAFAWHPLRSTFGMTLSSGEVYLGHFDTDLVPETKPTARLIGTHDLEAWTLAFGVDSLYSGGDDSALNFWSFPQDYSPYVAENAENESPVISWSDKRTHGAGVTAILPIASDKNDFPGTLLLTGSYDDHIRLIHVQDTGRRKVLAESNLGGGVWRLKLITPTPADLHFERNPEVNFLILASCMHAGARILKLMRDKNNDWHFEVLAQFEEHKSMNYGSDCQPNTNSKGQYTFITTSFYDRLLCLWRY